MADKQLLPGRERQRVRPGLAIKEVFIKHRQGVTIGQCHRYYSALLIEQWQADNRDKINADFDRRVRTMRGDKREAIEERRDRRLAKVNNRKRFQGAPTYDSFRRYFNYLVSLEYVEREMLEVAGVKPGEPQRIIPKVVKPRMRGDTGSAMASEIADQYTTRLRGGKAKLQIEPPVTYRLTAIGESADWSDPAGDWRRSQ